MTESASPQVLHTPESQSATDVISNTCIVLAALIITLIIFGRSSKGIQIHS